MAAPSKNFTSIPDNSIDEDSPLDTTLMTQIRDSLIHLEEWLGHSYTAAQDHDHDGTNSKVTVLDVSVGDYLSHTNVAERSTGSTSYVKRKESIIRGKGALRITFELKSGSAPAIAYGKIYRNGSPVGIERTNNTESYVEFSEDIVGWTDGDLVQVYIKGTGGNLALVQNLKLYGDVAFSGAGHKDN